MTVSRSQPMKDLADRTLRDWAQAAEENPVLKARVKVLEDVLQKAQRIIDRDFPNGQLAIDIRAALQPKAGS